MDDRMSKENNQICLSVVIPAYNEVKFLPACLSSLKKQDFKGGFEVIVVDNNSSDKTSEVARHFGARVVIEKQKGVCFARQRGASMAKGDIIVSTDADCTFSSNWLRNIHEAFKSPSTIGAIGPFLFDPKPMWGRIYSKLLFGMVTSVYSVNKKIIYPPASNFAYRKETWQQVGGYNTALTQGGDEYDIFMRLQKKGFVKYLPKNTVFTSSRRLNKGLIYNIVSLFGYYLVDYLAARLIGRSILGSWPDFREVKAPKRSWVVSSLYIILSVFLAASIIFGSGKVYAKTRVLSGSKVVFSATRSASKDTLADLKTHSKVDSKFLRRGIHRKRSS